MLKTQLEERQMVCDVVQGQYHAQIKDIRRIVVDNLIMDWLIEGMDLRLHFFFFVDSTRYHEDGYLEQLRAFQKAGQLPTSPLWPFEFGNCVLPIIAEHFGLVEPRQVTMEWLSDVSSWDTQVRRVCVVASPSEENLIKLATTINSVL